MYKEYYGYNVQKTLTGGAGTSFESSTIKLDSDAFFELHKIVFMATSGNILMRIRDSLGKYINPTAVDLRAIGGTPNSGNQFNPFVLATPYRFSKSSNIIIEMADGSGSGNTVYLSLHGAKTREGIAPWQKNFQGESCSFYTTERVTVSANGAASAVIKIDDDADFMIQKIMAVRTGAALVTLNEGGRGLDWSNAAFHIDNVCGNGQFPHNLTAPRFLPRSSTLTFNIQDLSGSSNVVEIVLAGARLYE